MAYVWKMYGRCMEYVWNMCGPGLDPQTAKAWASRAQNWARRPDAGLTRCGWASSKILRIRKALDLGWPNLILGSITFQHRWPDLILGSMTFRYRWPDPILGSMTFRHQGPDLILGSMTFWDYLPYLILGGTTFWGTMQKRRLNGNNAGTKTQGEE